MIVSEVNEFQELADNIYQYVKDKLAQESTTQVSYFRAQVTVAASGGYITVKRPFDSTTLSLPYVSSMEDVTVGSQVTVLVLGSMSNAIIIGNGTLSNL